MTPETKNMIAAMSLSLAILIGWQIYFVEPELEADRAAYEAQQLAQKQAQLDGQNIPQPQSGSAGSTASQSLVETVDTGERLEITAPLVTGSISTMGGRIDDLILTSYYQTLEADSDPIRLLSPFDSERPYFAEFGWVNAAGQTLALPNSKTVWQTESNGLTPDMPLVLRHDNGQGLVFERRIEINNDYLITVTQSVTSSLDEAVSLNPYGLIRRNGTPATSGLYILHEGPLGVFDETLNEQDYDDLRDAGAEGIVIETKENGGWIGITDKYWLAALMPAQNRHALYSMRALGATRDTYQTDLLGDAQTLNSGQTISWQTNMFAGAKRVALLDKYSQELKIANFDLAIDFGWFYFLTKPFFYAVSWLNGLLGNFGLAIIAFTILVRLVLFPLANKSYKSMARMRDLAPKVKKMREDIGDDKTRLNQEMMALYKREKVNPAAGCLPILLQIPVFFALYKVLYVSIEMRHAPFYGWIQDLSAIDPTSIFNLFGLLPYSVDFMPQFLSIGIWPILMGISMAIQMRLNPPPPDPIQAKIFQWMPVFFTFLLAGFPAGLVIYWTWNNTLSIAQQWWITKTIQKQSQKS
jgi:YidC/Oxa1 family membrane protein insertase